MGDFDTRELCSLVTVLVGLSLLGVSAWALSGFSAGPAEGDGFGAGGAFFLALLLGVAGVAVVGTGLVLAPASGADARVLAVGSRQRRVAGAGVTALAAGVVAPFAVLGAFDIVMALRSWLWLTAGGASLVGAAFVWTTGVAVLTRLDVV